MDPTTTYVSQAQSSGCQANNLANKFSKLKTKMHCFLLPLKKKKHFDRIWLPYCQHNIVCQSLSKTDKLTE